jgi:hypothetical protein
VGQPGQPRRRRPDDAAGGVARARDLPVLRELAELAALLDRHPELFVRWSKGPEHDAGERSRDHASGLDLPGLAVNPLRPPGWWTLPVEDWLARQVRAYAHLGEDDSWPHERAWVLTGRIVDRGPDNEPVVTDVTPLAVLDGALLHEAAEREPRSPRRQDQDTSWRS